MNKTELINAIAENAGLNKADAKKALDATISAISEALKKGDKIALVGFGTFSVNESPARTGINPRTKEQITIAAKKIAKFKAGAELADALQMQLPYPWDSPLPCWSVGRMYVRQNRPSLLPMQL